MHAAWGVRGLVGGGGRTRGSLLLSAGRRRVLSAPRPVLGPGAPAGAAPAGPRALPLPPALRVCRCALSMPGTARGAVEAEMASSGLCPWQTQPRGEDSFPNRELESSAFLVEQDLCALSSRGTDPLLCVSLRVRVRARRFTVVAVL